tara:strand:- start:3700 stop:4587 length:888 start_codon:yes stop_codon:yes gene_type:complete
MNYKIPCNYSLINDPKNYYSNKLLKMNVKCISHSLTDAENTINNSYKYLTIIHEYLQKIKEEIDGLFRSDIPFCKFIAIMKILKVYVKEVDYTISQSVYNDKFLIVSPSDENKELHFTFALPYNYKNKYPIGLPISSAINNFLFTYSCPVIDSIVLGLDFVLTDFLVKKYIIEVNSELTPNKNTIIRIGNSSGIFINKENNTWEVDIFYNYDSVIVDETITDLKNIVNYGTIQSITNVTNIEGEYHNLEEITSYLQYITDIAVKYVWDHIDKISYYLYICEINNKLLKSTCKRII